RESLGRLLPLVLRRDPRLARVRPGNGLAHLPGNGGGQPVRRVCAERSGELAMTRREDGMSLVEVLLVMTLMLIVLGATLTTFNQFERKARDNQNLNEAQDN